MCILYWRLFPLGILQNKKIRGIFYFFEFSLDTNACSMYDYGIERTSVRLEGL